MTSIGSLVLAFSVTLGGAVPERRPIIEKYAHALRVGAASHLTSVVAPQDTTNLEGLNRYAGKLIHVEDRRGQEILARVVASNDRELLVTVGGVERRIPAGEIRRIWMRGSDSLRNGTLIGAAIGVPWGILACQGHATSNCPIAGQAVVGAVVMAGIGAWIDSRRDSRIVLYRAP